MAQKKLHLHSMMAHAVAALVPLASLTWIAEAVGFDPAGLDPGIWVFMTRLSLILVLAMALPTTISGIGERNHMYAKWHSTHKIKLVLSLALVMLTALETWALLATDVSWELTSWLGLLIVVVNNAVSLALGAYGLKITLGRQALGRASYTPDMDRDPPVDILQVDAPYVTERPKTAAAQSLRGLFAELDERISGT